MQIGDVSAPHLIRTCGPQAWNRSGLLWWPGPATAMGLAMGVEHPVEAALLADIKPAIGQNGHDLARRQRSKFRFVAGEQDPLALFFAEAVGYMAMAAFAAVQAVPIACELPPPALQRRQPHAQQPGQFAGPGTVGHSLIEDLQSLLAVDRRGQSSPSSPQKA